MKEFIVNDRKLATVECNVPMFECPVFQKVFDIYNREMPLFATTYNQKTGIRMETVPDRVNELRAKVMDLCLKCCVKGR